MSNKPFIRLLSQISKKRLKTPENEDVLKAIKLLSNTDSLISNTEVLTNAEKAVYINQFTKALNKDINKQIDLKNHFNQSIIGLNQLLKTKNRVDVKQVISKSDNEAEVLEIFKDLLYSNELNLSNFRLILLNKNVKDLKYILNKLEFMNKDNKYELYKILILQKAIYLKDEQLSHSLYNSNFESWLSLRNTGKLSKFLEKSLYQIINKLNSSLLLELQHTNKSFITLVETIPKDLNKYTIIEKSLKLSKNQDLFIKFVRYLNTQLNSTKFIKRLLKLSIDNKVYLETLETDDLTIQKYRFLNNLIDLSTDLIEVYGKDEALLKITRELHENDDILINETMLKFI